jgi:hypothetical protein
MTHMWTSLMGVLGFILSVTFTEKLDYLGDIFALLVRSNEQL